MKAVYAALVLIALAGCGSSNSSSDTKPNQSNGTPTTGGAGQTKVSDSFLSNAWCNTYTLQGRELQERFTFTRDGLVTYTQYVLENGKRTAQTGSSKGTWGTNGTYSQVALNKFVFEMQYTPKDALHKTSA